MTSSELGGVREGQISGRLRVAVGGAGAGDCSCRIRVSGGGQGGGTDVLVGDDNVVRLEGADDVLDKDRGGLLCVDVITLHVPEAEEVCERNGNRRLAYSTNHISPSTRHLSQNRAVRE